MTRNGAKHGHDQRRQEAIRRTHQTQRGAKGGNPPGYGRGRWPRTAQDTCEYRGRRQRRE